MPPTVTTSVTELPESRVRVDAQVPAEEVRRRVEQKARDLGRSMKIPGFRKGKVPPALVIQRVGREAVLDEAIRDTLVDWYRDAIDTSGISPVGDPKVDLGDPPADGEALSFSIEIGVRPAATLGEYKGLEVGRRDAAVPDDDIGREIDGMRERLAKLEAVERPAETGDFVVIDYVGSRDGVPFDGGEGRDQLLELGSGRLIPGFEEQLTGTSAGDERTIELTFPADYGHEELAGQPASFAVTVKEVKHKELPELDDDFAIDNGFDDMDELREDVRTRLTEREVKRVDAEFREAALDAAVATANVDVPEPLVRARATELWEQMLHSLSHRGISREAYLQIAGRSEDEVLAEAMPEAEQALKREAVIAAVVAAEQLRPSDDDVLAALQPLAEREGVEPAELLADLQKSGRLDEVREDLAARQAVDLIADAAKPIPLEQAAAREALWTPEKAEGGTGGRLWTPGS